MLKEFPATSSLDFSFQIRLFGKSLERKVDFEFKKNPMFLLKIFFGYAFRHF